MVRGRRGWRTTAWVAYMGAALASAATRGTAQDKQTNPAASLPPRPAANITIAPNFHIASFKVVGGKIVLPVRLNGKNVGDMVLDTGTNSCLLPQAATTLGLKMEPYPEAGPNSKYGAIARLTIGNAVLTDMSVEVAQFPFLEAWNKAHPQSKICGLLGRDGIEDWAVGLDFVNHTLGLWQGGKLPLSQVRGFNSMLHQPGDALNAIRVLAPGETVTLGNSVVANPPLSADMLQTLSLSHKDVDGYYLIAVGLGTATRLMVLDTGSDSSTTLDAARTKSGVTSANLHPLLQYDSLVHGTGGVVRGSTYTLRALTLGSVSVDFPLLTVVPQSSALGRNFKDADWVLGMDTLTNCRVIVDFPGKKLYVSPYADYNHTPARLTQRLGLFINLAGGRHEILALFAGYPAILAGMKVDDELLDVNGTPAGQWLAAADRMLADKTFALRVRRKGQAEALTFTLAMPTP